MQYHLKPREKAERSVKRIALKQIECGISDIENSDLDRHDVVHRLRKRCKKQRGLLRLVRSYLTADYSFENAFYRDLSASLSSLRDAQALLEAHGRILDDFADEISASDFFPIRDYLTSLLEQEVGRDDELQDKLNDCAQQLRAAEARIHRWKLCETGFDAFEAGLARTYRRGRKAMRIAGKAPTTENLHEWRKRVKYHWYHSRIFRRVSPRLLKPHRLMSADLGSLLGQDHDLAVLTSRLVDATPIFASRNQAETLQAYLSLVKIRREQIQADAFQMGRHLFAETPKRLTRRWRAYWEAWQPTTNDFVPSDVEGVR